MNRLRNLKKEKESVSGKREGTGRKIRLSSRNQGNIFKKLESDAVERSKEKTSLRAVSSVLGNSQILSLLFTSFLVLLLAILLCIREWVLDLSLKWGQ